MAFFCAPRESSSPPHPAIKQKNAQSNHDKRYKLRGGQKKNPAPGIPSKELNNESKYTVKNKIR